MTSRPLTTLISCRGAEKTLCLQRTFGRSTNWTRVFAEMNLARVPGFEMNLWYLVVVLYHSWNHPYIENSWNAALGSHGISKLTKQKLSSIAKVKTSFDSFFRVENISQWCRLFLSTRSACGHQKRSAEPPGHQIRLAQREKIYFERKSYSKGFLPHKYLAKISVS